MSAGVVLAAAASASGQGSAGWNIEFVFAPGQTGITPRTPSCTVRVWAWFSPPVYAFAAARWDILASEGEWSQNRVLPPLTVGASPGVIAGTSVTGILVGQIHFPPTLPADPSNPIAAWEATWTATSFEGRPVSFHTRTNRFDVYCSIHCHGSRLSGLVEGKAELPVASCACYADCDTTTGCNSLDIFDFLCFQNRFAAAAPFACDCDTSTGPGVCDVLDFLCFQNAFEAGCP